MERHMICVRNKPDAPTIPPTETSRISPMAIPAMAPATPLSELSNEMVMGISAPPTRIEKAYPKIVLTAMHTRIKNVMLATEICDNPKIIGYNAKKVKK